jgi:hypothetical protein
MQQKLSIFSLYGLIWGTGFMKIWYDPYADQGRGKHMAAPVVPYRIYTNRTATSIEDCEYIIQEEDMTMGWIRRNFPDKARTVSKVLGLRQGDKRERDRDFIREGDINDQQRIISAQNVNGNITSPQYAYPNPGYMEDDSDTVQVLEYWLRDDSLESYERQKEVDGELQFEPMTDDEGLTVFETVGQKVSTSEIDGGMFTSPIEKPKMKPVMETAWRLKYPGGRLVMIAGGRVLLRDIPNPFQINEFPYAMWKDYDVGAFYGQGEPLALKDSQIASNRIVSQIYDILEKTGNPSFKMLKGGGVNAQSIKNKPGAIIPMDDLKALEPLEKPAMPPQFLELYQLLRTAMGEISGLNDSVVGQIPAGNTAFATMDQLQESGAAPLRLKVRNLETGIKRIGKLRIQLIQQWDTGARPIREQNESPEVVQQGSSVEVQFRDYNNPDLQGPVEFNIVPISSLSTSPAGAWNRWMMMYDKHLIDRQWWHQKFRIEGWKTELPRMMVQEKQDQAAENAAKEKGKPGPSKSKPARSARKSPAPKSHVPSAAANSSVR